MLDDHVHEVVVLQAQGHVCQLCFILNVVLNCQLVRDTHFFALLDFVDEDLLGLFYYFYQINNEKRPFRKFEPRYQHKLIHRKTCLRQIHSNLNIALQLYLSILHLLSHFQHLILLLLDPGRLIELLGLTCISHDSRLILLEHGVHRVNLEDGHADQLARELVDFSAGFLLGLCELEQSAVPFGEAGVVMDLAIVEGVVAVDQVVVLEFLYNIVFGVWKAVWDQARFLAVEIRLQDGVEPHLLKGLLLERELVAHLHPHLHEVVSSIYLIHELPRAQCSIDEACVFQEVQ